MKTKKIIVRLGVILYSAALAAGPHAHHHHGRHSLHSEDWTRFGIGALLTILSSALTPQPVIVTSAYTSPQPVVVVPSAPVVQTTPVTTAPAPVVVVPGATGFTYYYYPSHPVVTHHRPIRNYYYHRPAPPPQKHHCRPAPHPHRQKK